MATTATAPTIAPIEIQEMTLRIVGDSPLIVHQWSEKAKQMMRDKHQKKASKAGREERNPDQEYQESMYRMADGTPGFPAVGFKAAAVSACSQVAGLTKVEARGAFHVIGELIGISGEHRMREDMVRVGMGAADLRYRAEFPAWEAEVTIRYNPRVLSAEQIANLFNIAGFAVGVGEWRPEKDGSFGMFHVG